MTRTEYMREYRKSKEKSCPICQEHMILQESKACINCTRSTRIKSNKWTVADATYVNHHKSSAFALIRSRARTSVKEELKNPSCESCGYSKHVEVCHIKGIADFPEDTPIYVVNNRSNLKLLCPNCHWELDHNLF